MNQRKYQDQLGKSLDSKERLFAAIKSLCCILSAILVLLYGLVIATNLSTYLNPVNAILNVLVAVVCYGVVMLLFIFLWHLFIRYMTLAFSSLE